MGGIRIRWRALAKVATITVGAVAALQALPGLLRPPEPPPLAEDVGLRGIAVEPRPTERVEFLSHAESKSPRPKRKPPLPPDVISSVPHRHLKPKTREEPEVARTKARPPRAAVSTSSPPAAESPAAPAPEPALPPPIEPGPPPPQPAPAPPPPPADGSEEFAPH